MMKILYGPLPPLGMKPFSGKIQGFLHLDSGGERTHQADGLNNLISFCISDANHHMLETIYHALPSDWQPDVCIFCFPEFNLLPKGLEDLPCPVVALIGDWYITYATLIQNLENFDYIFTVKSFTKHLKQQGFERFETIPIFTRDLQIFQKLPEIEKCYDVGFVGNLRTSIHTSRANYLRRLAALNQKYRICITTDLYDAAYVQFLNRAKIIFNHTLLGDLNQRCFEAMGCGALLMIEETNQEISDYLKPGQDYIPYNSENFEKQIAYYLTHAQERDTIANSGHQAIQALDIPLVWKHLLDKIELLLKTGGIRRSRKTGTPHSLALKTFWSVIPPHNHLQVAAAELLLELQKIRSPLLLNDLAVIYFTTFLSNQDYLNDYEKHVSLLHHAKHFLLEALEISPNYPIALYNLATVFQTLNLSEEAQKYWHTLRTLDEKYLDLPQVFEGLLAFPSIHKTFTRYYDPIHMHWQRIYYEQHKNDRSAKIYQLLQASALKNLSTAQHKDKIIRLNYGKESLATADEYTDLTWWIEQLFDAQEFQTLLTWFWQYQTDPLAPKLWLIHCQTLEKLGWIEELQLWAWYYLQFGKVSSHFISTAQEAQLKKWGSSTWTRTKVDEILSDLFHRLGLTGYSEEDYFQSFFHRARFIWNPPFPETNFSSEITAHFCLLSNKTEKTGHCSLPDLPLQRQHHKGSAYDPWLLPFQFPEIAKNDDQHPLTQEIQTLAGLKIALFHNEDSPSILKALFQTQLSISCIVWKPAFSEDDFNALEAGLTPEEQSHLLLWETESTDDLSILMSLSDLNLFSRLHTDLFYLCWSLWLGKPCYCPNLNAIEIPYPISNTELMLLTGGLDAHTLKRTLLNLNSLQEQAQTIKTQLRSYYQSEVTKQCLRELWRSQLNQVQTHNSQ